VTRRLRDERLVALVGRSGIGKTRLAVEVADALQPADGAWLVELGATVRPDAVLPAVTAALGVRDQPGVDAHAALVAALRPLDAVLVADGCDCVLPAVTALLTGLVADCPRLRALTTSVDAPDAPAPYALGPLPVPGAADDVAGNEAVALLLTRARDGAAHHEHGDHHRDEDRDHDPLALARLARVAGGVPLDLELVAARLRTTTAAELAASLDHHQGAVLPWTLAARHPDERRLLRRLSVFPGAFGHAAATVVAAGEVDELLPALARSSLVVAESAGPQRRFRLPDAVRAEVGPAPDDAAARHAGACLELVERAGDRLRTHAAASWFGRLDLEQASLRAALHWTVCHAPADAVRLVQVLGWYWFRRGRIAEGRGFTDAALEASADCHGLARSGAHLSAAALAYHAGDLAALGEHVGNGLADARSRGEGGRDVVRLLLFAAWHAALSAGPERAGEPTEQALLLAAGDPEVLGEALLTRGMLERYAGTLDTAAETLERARAVATTAGNTWAAGSAQWIAAKVALDRGHPAQAHALFAESLRQAVVDDDVASGLVNLLGIAGVAAAAGDPQRGAQLLGAIAALGERIGYDPVRMDPLDGPRAVEAVRSALSEPDFTAALARGRETSFPEATALGYAGLRPA
jgi:predicted ATPase